MRMWKFVYDSTVSKQLTRNNVSVIRPALTLIESWCSNNWMILNAKKCKELRMSYLKNADELQPIIITGRELEIVKSHKVLGLTFRFKITWDEHISVQ